MREEMTGRRRMEWDERYEEWMTWQRMVRSRGERNG